MNTKLSVAWKHVTVIFFFGQIMFPGNQIHDLGIATSQATVY